MCCKQNLHAEMIGCNINSSIRKFFIYTDTLLLTGKIPACLSPGATIFSFSVSQKNTML